MSTDNITKEKFVLTITADSIKSTDPRFDINNLGLGDNYKALDAKFQNASGTIITRDYKNG